jgi:hypothetical protein
MAVTGLIDLVAQTNAFEFALAWPKLTIDVASTLFDSTWRDHRD